jgi:hypothetical protein
VQDRAAQATAALAQVNNASAQVIAGIQANTSLSVAEKQAQSAQAVAAMNNQNAIAVANLQNASSLANIQANGVINTQIQQLTDNNKTLLQTSSGASALYNQALTNLSAIITNPNLSTSQQTAALNNGVKQLNDGLAALNAIAGNQQAQSLLVFSDPTPAATTDTTGTTDTSGLGAAVQQVWNGTM